MAGFSFGNSLAETVQSASPYAMQAGWGQGACRQTHGAECKALAAGAGVSSGTSDGCGAPPVAAPEPIDTEPVAPELDVPELNTSSPLAPLVPALAVRMLRAPLVDVAPSPVLTCR